MANMLVIDHLGYFHILIAYFFIGSSIFEKSTGYFEILLLFYFYLECRVRLFKHNLKECELYF